MYEGEDMRSANIKSCNMKNYSLINKDEIKKIEISRTKINFKEKGNGFRNYSIRNYDIKCMIKRVMSNIEDRSNELFHKSNYTFIVGKYILLTVCLLMIINVIMIVFYHQSIKVNASPEKASYKYYTQVIVPYGSTMEDIAEKYISEEYVNIESYIEEVKHINSFYGDKLNAGSYLIVPYYDSILK